MLTLLVIAWLSQSAQPKQNDAFSLSLFSYAEGSWETNVTESDLRGLPTWNPDASDAPVLSPAEAVRAAKEVMGHLSLNKTWPDRWTLGSITLEPVHDDNWVYVVKFSESAPPCEPAPGRSGCGSAHPVNPDSDMRIVVLLNGHAVSPVLKKR